LMPIMGWVRVLKSHASIMGNSDLAVGIQSLERNAHNIHRLIEDCLDMSRISEHKMGIKMAAVDVSETLTASVGAVADMARAKGLRVSLDLSPETVFVWADRTRLEQVAVNLLTNAIRYTAAGGSIAIRSQRRGSEVEI